MAKNKGTNEITETATAPAAETVARTYRSVNGKEINNEAPKGNLSFVRPAQLAKDGVTGVVAQGIYEGTLENKFDAGKPDFKVRDDAGNLIILNSAGSLAKQLNRVAVGSYVQIIYKGKTEMTQGKMAGKQSHSFVVLIAD